MTPAGQTSGGSGNGGGGVEAAGGTKVLVELFGRKRHFAGAGAGWQVTLRAGHSWAA